jgi:hypothetical protein
MDERRRRSSPRTENQTAAKEKKGFLADAADGRTRQSYRTAPKVGARPSAAAAPAAAWSGSPTFWRAFGSSETETFSASVSPVFRRFDIREKFLKKEERRALPFFHLDVVGLILATDSVASLALRASVALDNCDELTQIS